MRILNIYVNISENLESFKIILNSLLYKNFIDNLSRKKLFWKYLIFLLFVPENKLFRGYVYIFTIIDSGIR